MAEAKKRVKLAVCLMSDEVKSFEFVEKFLKRLSIEYDTIGIKEISIRTSLPEVAYSEEDVKMTNFVFQSFEMAKKVLS